MTSKFKVGDKIIPDEEMMNLDNFLKTNPLFKYACKIIKIEKFKPKASDPPYYMAHSAYRYIVKNVETEEEDWFTNEALFKLIPKITDWRSEFK